MAQSAKNATKRENLRERECQTEASFHPVISDVYKKLTDSGCKQFEDLMKLRDIIKIAMTELGSSVYDVNAYKDVILSIAHNLPEMPVTDLLLLSSKLFRRTSELGRLLGAFFNVVFAEDFADEEFHFVELRIVRREMQLMRQKLDSLVEEKKQLQELYDELGKGSLDHAKAVEVLENRNDILELRSSALEDQMALLFQQLADDFRSQNVQLLQQAIDDCDVQEQLSATRTAFTQSVETVQNRLKFFQSLLVEIQDDPILQQDQGFKNKVKSLDVHVQHILNRFGAVKDGLMNTASELVQALVDKKKALNFSVQHLKLYDLQNSKLRQARAAMHEMRNRITELERMITHSFPQGGVTRIERNGEILSLMTSTGGTFGADSHVLLPPSMLDAHMNSTAVAAPSTALVSHHQQVSNEAAESLRKSKFTVSSVRQLLEHVQMTNDVVIRLTAALDTEDEQKGLLRTISLSAPTSGRQDGSKERIALAQLTNKNFIPTAQQPPLLVDAPRTSTGLSAGGGGGGGGGGASLASVASGIMSKHNIGGGGGGSMDSAQLAALRDDFTVKLNFLRDVYEERISDLEGRLERVNRKLLATQAELARNLKEEAKNKESTDRDAILKAKEAWMQARETTLVESQPTRSTALQATQEILKGATAVPMSNMSDFSMESRPMSAKSSESLLGPAPNSGLATFISPQARLQFQRQNAEKRDEYLKQGGGPTATVFTATPKNKHGPVIRTEASVVRQEKNEQMIRAMRRLTGVDEFLPPPTFSGQAAGSPPPPRPTGKQ